MNGTLCYNTRERIDGAIASYREERGSVPMPVAVLQRRLLDREDYVIVELEHALRAVEQRDGDGDSHLAFVLDEAIWEARRAPARGGRSRW